MTEIYRDYNGIEFERIYALCKELFPRRKHTAYTTKKDETGKKKYVLIYNISKVEFVALSYIYAERNQ